MHTERVNAAISGMPFADKRQAYIDWENACLRGLAHDDFKGWLFDRTADRLEREDERHNADMSMDRYAGGAA